MSKAKDIISRAKAELVGFIKYETELISRIYNAIHTDEGGAYTEEEDWPWSPSIEVPVDNSYIDVYDDCTEQRKVIGIYIDEDGKPYVTTEEGDEIFCENLSVEELGKICDCLEVSYAKAIKK